MIMIFQYFAKGISTVLQNLGKDKKKSALFIARKF